MTCVSLPAHWSSRALRHVAGGVVCAHLAWTVYASEGERPLYSEARAPSSSAADPVRIFFPPTPPPLGGTINRRVHPTAVPPPAELTAYVGEIFYSSLGTRIYHDKLTVAQRGRIEAYQTSRIELLNQLRAKLDSLRGAEAAARIQELMALSREQAPKLAALERDAQELWQSLTRSGDAWGALRQWKLGDRDPRPYTGAEVAAVMRASAFYDTGWSQAQRGLLREIAIELEAVADSTENAMFAQPYLFFSPALSRITLPADTAPEVMAKIADFQSRKSELKKELFDAVHGSDGKMMRGRTFQALAMEHAPRIAKLEVLAEEIRLGLTQNVDATQVIQRSPLPRALQARVKRMIAGYLAAQERASERMDAIVVRYQRNPVLRVGSRFEGERLKVNVHKFRGLSLTTRGIRPQPVDAPATEVAERAQAEIVDVENEYGHQLAELINERMAIREEMRSALGSTSDAELDRALAAALRVARAEGSEDEYREYRIAVFQPGLSPEQRRLYFGSVLERLRLPAPLAEMQPRVRRPPQ